MLIPFFQIFKKYIYESQKYLEQFFLLIPFFKIFKKHTYDHAFDIIDKIRDGKIDLSDVKNNQEKFQSYLGEIRKGNKKHRSKEQKITLYNIEILYKRSY